MRSFFPSFVFLSFLVLFLPFPVHSFARFFIQSLCLPFVHFFVCSFLLSFARFFVRSFILFVVCLFDFFLMVSFYPFSRVRSNLWNVSSNQKLHTKQRRWFLFSLHNCTRDWSLVSVSTSLTILSSWSFHFLRPFALLLGGTTHISPNASGISGRRVYALVKPSFSLVRSIFVFLRYSVEAPDVFPRMPLTFLGDTQLVTKIFSVS